MKIRAYTDCDLDEIAKIFYETVHAVNSADYSAEQLSAWAQSAESLKARRADLLNQFTLVAEDGGKIIGFGSINSGGCLDLLFVHKNHLRHGVATELCNRLEKGFSHIKTYASVTAKPFFEKRGYAVKEEREVERCGVKLKNFEMQKTQH